MRMLQAVKAPEVSRAPRARNRSSSNGADIIRSSSAPTAAAYLPLGYVGFRASLPYQLGGFLFVNRAGLRPFKGCNKMAFVRQGLLFGRGEFVVSVGSHGHG